MEHGLGFLFLCNHKLSYRLFLIAVLAFHVCCSFYCLLVPQNYDESLEFLANDRPTRVMRYLQIVGGLLNIVISIVWFLLNQQMVRAVEVDLIILKVNLISDASVTKCLKEPLAVFLVGDTLFLILFAFIAKDCVDLAGMAVFVINTSFVFGCCSLLRCSLLLLGSSYDDLIRFNKNEYSVVKCQHISNVFDNINHLFKLPMFLIISRSFLVAWGNLYILLNPSMHTEMAMNLFLFMATLYNVYPVLLVIRSCNKLKNKAKTFNQQLYWEMAEDKSFRLLQNEKLNFFFLVNEEMIFTACDFFAVDNSLIFSMISTATTYLVILLQYEMNESPTVLPPNATSFAPAQPPTEY